MTYEESVIKLLKDSGPLTRTEIAQRIPLKYKTQVYDIVERLKHKDLVDVIGKNVFLVENQSPFTPTVEQINNATKEATQDKIPKPDIKVAILQEEIDECDAAIDHYQRVRAYLRSRVTELQF
jgi:sugar-specific transcriptional regulator TrmB